MKLFGLIGYPLSHSFSKKYFTQKFTEEAITDCLFELFPLEEITEFPPLIQAHDNLRGLAVTIPYKEKVIPFLSALDDEAKAIGAVNCICVYGSTLKGYNTDVRGFEKSFVPLLKKNHRRALVLGTGGASKAIQFVLKKLGIEYLLVSRQRSEHTICYEDLDEKYLQTYPVIINCTPVGMVPNEQYAPAIPYEYIGAHNYLYDLIYKPAETKFLQEGKRRGAVVKNGYEMLIIQAEENWRLWNKE